MTSSGKSDQRSNQSLKPTPPVFIFTFFFISFLSSVCHARSRSPQLIFVSLDALPAEKRR